MGRVVLGAKRSLDATGKTARGCGARSARTPYHVCITPDGGGGGGRKYATPPRRLYWGENVRGRCDASRRKHSRRLIGARRDRSTNSVMESRRR